jgi:hypothetical protein
MHEVATFVFEAGAISKSCIISKRFAEGSVHIPELTQKKRFDFSHGRDHARARRCHMPTAE